MLEVWVINVVQGAWGVSGRTVGSKGPCYTLQALGWFGQDGPLQGTLNLVGGPEALVIQYVRGSREFHRRLHAWEGLVNSQMFPK